MNAIFYFLVGGNSKFDPGHFDHYQKEAKKFKSEIENSNHRIGLHPSYDTVDNPDLLIEEKEKIENWLGHKVTYSRQHYLRVDVLKTWSSLMKAGLHHDSSLGYPQQPGFRCGTSREFSVFDLVIRQELEIKEQPLIAMDTSLLKDSEMTIEDKYDLISDLKNQIKINGGVWHFLIHNSNFFWLDEKEYFELWHSFYEF